MIKLCEEKNRKERVSGWILYTMPERIRNRHYIELYKKACKKYGMSVSLGIYELYDQPDSLFSLQMQQLQELVLQEKPVFAVNRTRDYRLAKALEALGVYVYNNSQIAELGNDKAKGYQYMEQHGIPIMPVFYGTDTAPDRYPAVVKSCAGHGGTEVFLLKSTADWIHWKETGYQRENRYVVQYAASDMGKDLRVYVVGNQIVASILRTSQQDFRSNVSMGGQAQLYQLNQAQRSLAEQIISLFQIGMAGIDFIFHQGQMMFNEIEDMVGARMLYSLTEYDIVDAYVRYIWEDLKRHSMSEDTV